MATRCRCPPESCFGLRSSSGVEPEHVRPPTRRAARSPRRGDLPQAQAEREVLAHGHVRVERVVLEHHRHVALARRQRGDVAVADADRPVVTASSPASMRRIVDLPEPEPPTSTSSSPSATSRSKSSTIVVVAEALADVLEGDGWHGYPLIPAPAMLSMK